ncbi:gastrula zinc finger protein XlCGF57.1-like [Phycodurus eques]|uniref:gastrula zinc finger protein XlCGF57.1-like n=1 Tax=Phycodurus eques TaxID=693459 RepID=UPI002ACE8037|nr:gastrula zinc finger protein XlCGF57.1-like [Phycodurus eques]
MLKELVRERLIAAADEIFGLFEKTIASYEEQLRRGREETERHRRQLEAVCKTQVVIRIEDVQQLIGRQEELPPQPQWGSSSLKQDDRQGPHVKEEEEDPQPPHVKEEEGVADIGMLPLTGGSAESENHEDKQPESSQLHHHSPSGDHCGGPPPDNLFAPLSHNDDIEEPLRSDANCEGDDKQLKSAKKETTIGSKQRCNIKVTCSICGKRFGKANKIGHMRTHTGEKPFCCSICGRRFTLKPSMKTHMRTHTGEKPFDCSLCGKAFSQKDYVAIHMRTHTGEKPFSCSVCGKRFISKRSMVVHMKVHTGEKPFRCSVCGKGFVLNSLMIRHMTTHTGEKPFCCSVCGNKFVTKRNMLTHMRTHTGEKPFCCSTCGRTFAQKSTMVNHMRTHTKTDL